MYKYIFIILLLGNVSCVKMPKKNKGENVKPEDNIELVSFLFEKKNNPSLPEDMKCIFCDNNLIFGYVKTENVDLKNLVPTFTVKGKGNFSLTSGGIVQKSGETANDFTTVRKYVLNYGTNESKSYDINIISCTGRTEIPLIILNTEKSQPITSREVWIKAEMIVDPRTGNFESFRDTVEIKGRGHNSWTAPKKPYAIKLKSKISLMGMSKHKRWVLLANFNDKTLLRNRTAFEIAQRTDLAWTPDTRFADVIFNGEFVGNYLLCEQIRVDNNRVNIEELTKEDITQPQITGGYLIEIDRYYDEVNKFKTRYANLPVMIKSPDEEELNEMQFKYIQDYYAAIEDILYGPDFPGNTEYSNLIDIDSFIDYWIVYELVHCTEPRLPGSCYMYKNRNGKLFAGPVWDFDLTTFKRSREFKITDALWYPVLFTDPLFKQRVKERWNQFKPDFEQIPSFINREADYIKKSAAVNWELWNIDDHNYNQDESLSWEDALVKMKEYYLDRLQWMDSQINSW